VLSARLGGLVNSLHFSPVALCRFFSERSERFFYFSKINNSTSVCMNKIDYPRRQVKIDRPLYP
jgi:hypothetical protein